MAWDYFRELHNRNLVDHDWGEGELGQVSRVKDEKCYHGDCTQKFKVHSWIAETDAFKAKQWNALEDTFLPANSFCKNCVHEGDEGRARVWRCQGHFVDQEDLPLEEPVRLPEAPREVTADETEEFLRAADAEERGSTSYGVKKPRVKVVSKYGV